MSERLEDVAERKGSSRKCNLKDKIVNLKERLTLPLSGAGVFGAISIPFAWDSHGDFYPLYVVIPAVIGLVAGEIAYRLFKKYIFRSV